MINLEGVTSLNQIFTTGFFVFATLVALLNTCMAVIIARKYMQIMQSMGYCRQPYLKWVTRRENIYMKRLLMMVMLSVMAYLLFTIGFSYMQQGVNSLLSLIFYVFFSGVYIYFDFKRKNKARLVLTARVARLIATFVVLYYIYTLVVIVGMHMLGFVFRDNAYFLDVRFSVICLTPILIPFIVDLSNIINKPFENAKNYKYIERCKKTLQGAKNLTKIGLTGSYGKTTVKEILKTILSVKHNVLATPASYNTPMGICKSVSRYDGSQDIFIAEMGARQVGEIKELTDIVNPDYGIITGIGNQHLETFVTGEALLKTKYELVGGVKKDGAVVFATDNPQTLMLYQHAKETEEIKVLPSGNVKLDGMVVWAEDIVSGTEGSTFTICDGKDRVEATTVLMGKHNVSNIMVAVNLCYELGMTLSEIAEGINLIKPIRHRLEVTKNSKGITIIDDSYNSNVDGTAAALEVFSAFKGRKIIITPGLVELGWVEGLENLRFGRRMAKVVDFAILVGGPNVYKMRDGLLDANFDYDNIKIVANLNEAVKFLKTMLQEGDVILFENDLPDKFM